MRVGQARKRDWNEAELVSALRAIGVTVERLSAPGLPDLLCWHPREGFRLLEVKQPRGRLTMAQERQTMPYSVVRSVGEALALYGVETVEAPQMARRKSPYTDGVGVQRCEVCQSVLRAKDGEPLVSIRISDVEEIACILEQYVDCPEVWGETIKRLEQACGRTVKQISEANSQPLGLAADQPQRPA